MIKIRFFSHTQYLIAIQISAMICTAYSSLRRVGKISIAKSCARHLQVKIVKLSPLQVEIILAMGQSSKAKDKESLLLREFIQVRQLAAG